MFLRIKRSIERSVMWVCYQCDIFISVKVSPLPCFQNSKVWISAFQEDRKVLAFDLTMLHYVQNSQSPITPINYVKLQ